MKKGVALIVYATRIVSAHVAAQGIDPFLPDDSVYTKVQEQVIDTNDIHDPLRQ